MSPACHEGRGQAETCLVTHSNLSRELEQLLFPGYWSGITFSGGAGTRVRRHQLCVPLHRLSWGGEPVYTLHISPMGGGWGGLPWHTTQRSTTDKNTLTEIFLIQCSIGRENKLLVLELGLFEKVQSRPGLVLQPSLYVTKPLNNP